MMRGMYSLPFHGKRVLIPEYNHGDLQFSTPDFLAKYEATFAPFLRTFKNEPTVQNASPSQPKIDAPAPENASGKPIDKETTATGMAVSKSSSTCCLVNWVARIMARDTSTEIEHVLETLRAEVQDNLNHQDNRLNNC